MEILGVGPAELVLIALIAFVVLGPERLPAALYTLGKWVHQLRRTFDELGEMSAELNSAVGELHAIQQDLDEKFSSQLQKELGLTPQNSRLAAGGGLPPLRFPPDALDSGEGRQTQAQQLPAIAPTSSPSRKATQTAHQGQGLPDREGVHS